VPTRLVLRKVAAGTAVDIAVERDQLVVRPVRQRYRLRDLLKEIDARNLHAEIASGSPVGREVWSVPKRYVPERGDLVWLRFDPQAGHEQGGKRPALVISPAAYNGRVGLALLCPITSQRKGYPFEVPLPAGLKVQGVVLADQIKSLDWRVRHAERAGDVPAAVLEETVAKIRVLVEPEGAA
jgi:mRNA interferase MazF